MDDNVFEVKKNYYPCMGVLFIEFSTKEIWAQYMSDDWLTESY